MYQAHLLIHRNIFPVVGPAIALASRDIKDYYLEGKEQMNMYSRYYIMPS